MEPQGRHRYFRIAHPDVAHLLETLMGVSFGSSVGPPRSGPHEPALRRARVCYDHLAGELGVLMYDSLLRHGAFALQAAGLALSGAGAARVASLGIDPAAPPGSRRPFCRTCLDWSERRDHLAGALGSALLARFEQLGMAQAGAARAHAGVQRGRRGSISGVA